MSADLKQKPGQTFRVLTVAAMILMAVAYVSPIWWVSLSAPQYPEDVFPDGIRIHFHFDGVTNGCLQGERSELSFQDDDNLDCKHEMDAINHYVGMYPIAAGAPVERALSPFMVSLLAVLMVVFMLPSHRARVATMAAGGLGIAGWMTAALFMTGGVHLFSPGFVADLLGTMKLEPEEIAGWSGLKAIEESYSEALGRYFRDSKVDGMIATMMAATKVVYGLLLAAIAVLVVALWRLPRHHWVVGAIPVVLPVAFVADYAAWLWWFGHNLNEMGAFTVKPFMPTVFGQGKVAQFSTFSYPHYGFGLLVLVAVLMLLAVLIRRKQLKNAGFPEA